MALVIGNVQDLKYPGYWSGMTCLPLDFSSQMAVGINDRKCECENLRQSLILLAEMEYLGLQNLGMALSAFKLNH